MEVASADSTQGTGQYSTFYPDSTYQSITAVPSRGFRFSHWNDSVTDNPRTVFVTQDTVFTAYFDTLARYRLDVYSNDAERGYVTGGGTYYDGDEVTIRATAHAGYYFLRWNDGVGYIYRPVVLTQDTSFTAIFWREGEPVGVREAEAVGGQFRLLPNPASGEVRIVTEGEGFEGGTLAVSDAAGREVQRRELARGMRTCTLKVSDLPSGTYFVTLTTAKGTGTQKLIIN